MSDHYYSENPNSEHDYWEITARALGCDAHFTTDAGVFSRDGLDHGTEVLLDALPDLSGTRVLDLGCGWGPVGVFLNLKYPGIEVVMTDVNARAVELAGKNLARNGVSAQVVQGDAFENVSGLFDAIITNPPIRAGKQKIYEMFADARRYLKPEGTLYIVIRKQQGAPSALKYLRELYGSAEVISRSSGFWAVAASQLLPR